MQPLEFGLVERDLCFLFFGVRIWLMSSGCAWFVCVMGYICVWCVCQWRRFVLNGGRTHPFDQ